MASLEERLAAASTFLLQSPPGEVNDVFSDIRTLVAADAELEQGILPALKQYNKEQLTVVDLGGKKVLVTPVSRLGGQEEDGDEKSAEERHVDPEGQRSFVVDHMKVSAHSPLPLPVDHSTESLRSSLSSLLASYVANHYADGVSAVYALEDPAYPPPPPSAPAAEEKRPEGEAEHGVGETGSIAENVEGGEKDVAEVAAETVEAAEEALDKNEGEAVQPAAPTIEGEGGEGGQEEKQKEDKMDLGTPAAPSAIEEKEKVEPPPPSPSRLFGLYFVGNKYNPSNYWTGRWRSQYELDWEKGTLEGSVKIQPPDWVARPAAARRRPPAPPPA
ncbi:hypothetical protein JCM8547_002413, partial [Rhodosporidiobolus lusitaniae]